MHEYKVGDRILDAVPGTDNIPSIYFMGQILEFDDKLEGWEVCSSIKGRVNERNLVTNAFFKNN